jgi:hypothetical protein
MHTSKIDRVLKPRMGLPGCSAGKNPAFNVLDLNCATDDLHRGFACPWRTRYHTLIGLNNFLIKK